MLPSMPSHPMNAITISPQQDMMHSDRNLLSALRFFFIVTLDRADAARHLTFVHEPRKLPVVLSPEEVARLLETA